MCAGNRLAGKIVERAGQPFGHLTAVDEKNGRVAFTNNLQQARMNRIPDGDAARHLRGGPGGNLLHDVEVRHVLHRHLNAQAQLLGRAGVDDGDGPVARLLRLRQVRLGFQRIKIGFVPRLRGDYGGGLACFHLCPAEKARHFFQRALRGREANALDGLAVAAAHQRFKPLQRERHMRAALGGHQRVNLINDDGIDRTQSFSRARSQHQVERLRCGDENVGWVAQKTCTLTLRRVAGAHGDGGLMERDALLAREVGNARKRRAQIALHVYSQRLQRRDVHDTRAIFLFAF